MQTNKMFVLEGTRWFILEEIDGNIGISKYDAKLDPSDVQDLPLLVMNRDFEEDGYNVSVVVSGKTVIQRSCPYEDFDAMRYMYERYKEMLESSAIIGDIVIWWEDGISATVGVQDVVKSDISFCADLHRHECIVCKGDEEVAILDVSEELDSDFRVGVTVYNRCAVSVIRSKLKDDEVLYGKLIDPGKIGDVGVDLYALSTNTLEMRLLGRVGGKIFQALYESKEGLIYELSNGTREIFVNDNMKFDDKDTLFESIIDMALLAEENNVSFVGPTATDKSLASIFAPILGDRLIRSVPAKEETEEKESEMNPNM